MTTVTYIDPEGARHDVEIAPGRSLMEGAVNNGVPGILAQCGGACACATCHIYIPPEWNAVIGARSEAENAMLGLAMGRRATSRLACQIIATPAMDGLVIQIPDEQ